MGIFFVVLNILLTLPPVLGLLKAHNRVEDGKTHIHKGVTVRFGFDDRRTSHTLRIVKNKAMGTPHGVYYIQPSLALDHSQCRCGVPYMHMNQGTCPYDPYDPKKNIKLRVD